MPKMFSFESVTVLRAYTFSRTRCANADAFRVYLCRTSMVSPSSTETTEPVKADASTAKKEEMKKPTVDIENVSSLRLKWRVTNIHLAPKMKQEAQFTKGICA